MTLLKRFALLLALSVAFSLSVFAQKGAAENSKDGEINENYAKFPYWRCTTPGGTFAVNLHTITFVSTHEYIVDGLALVTELNVATSGSMIARFYSVEPLEDVSGSATVKTALNAAQSRLETVQRRVDPTGLSLKVAKSYPNSTHAVTVE